MSPLEIIGHIDIPSAIKAHRFVIEALACAEILGQNEESEERVVGTENIRQVELYGWASNVENHVDNTGFVYLLALNDGKSTVNIWNGDTPISLWFPVGTVIRLNDFHQHWTEDDGSRVCAFIGSWTEPADAFAMDQLQRAVNALGRGDYYGAPRVREGFRALLPDECLVPNGAFDQCEPMLLSDAESEGAWFERCAECEKPAIRLDHKWPFFTDKNRCAQHLGNLD